MEKTPPDFIKGEVLLINKPLYRTSFQVVSQVKGIIRNYFKIKKIKVGHAGTLDPLATGLLIICTGKETKNIERYQAMEKEYTGTFVLGATTPCFDMEKPVDAHYPVGHITAEKITEAAAALTGEIEQVPPLFSAMKISGERAYEIARRGETVVIPARKIIIREFEIARIEMPKVDFRVVCSKGTYIRSLARDFGLALSSGAYLSALCRTRIGNFSISGSLLPEEFEEKVKAFTNQNSISK